VVSRGCSFVFSLQTVVIYLNIGSLGLGAVILGLLRFISLDDCLNVAN